MSFQNKTVIITGASRGIGKAIGLRLAKEGANIVIASKSVEENPKLGGTIFSAAAEMEAAGGKALAVQCDIRFVFDLQNVYHTVQPMPCHQRLPSLLPPKKWCPPVWGFLPHF